MAMNIGAGSGEEQDVMIDINTTPLIDVMLVLLIMLIITIPVQLHAITLNMPVGNPPPPLVKPEVVRVGIDAAGTIRWNGELVASPAELDARLAAIATLPLQPELHVRPDRKVAYKTVAAVMAAVQRNRLTKVGIVGNEQFI
jgi:biopolymer transport protein ExbD